MSNLITNFFLDIIRFCFQIYLSLDEFIINLRLKYILAKHKNIVVGAYTRGITHDTLPFSRGQFTIGKFCSIAKGVKFLQCSEHNISLPSQYPLKTFLVYHGNKNVDALSKGPILIGHDVWIGINALILGNVEIGTGAVVGAGSVVTKNVPPYAVVAGVPAKVIKYRFSKDVIDRLLRIRWWDWSHETIMKNIEIFYFDVNTFLPLAENISVTEFKNMKK